MAVVDEGLRIRRRLVRRCGEVGIECEVDLKYRVGIRNRRPVECSACVEWNSTCGRGRCSAYTLHSGSVRGCSRTSSEDQGSPHAPHRPWSCITFVRFRLARIGTLHLVHTFLLGLTRESSVAVLSSPERASQSHLFNLDGLSLPPLFYSLALNAHDSLIHDVPNARDCISSCFAPSSVSSNIES